MSRRNGLEFIIERLRKTTNLSESEIYGEAKVEWSKRVSEIQFQWANRDKLLPDDLSLLRQEAEKYGIDLKGGT